MLKMYFDGDWVVQIDDVKWFYGNWAEAQLTFFKELSRRLDKDIERHNTVEVVIT